MSFLLQGSLTLPPLGTSGTHRAVTVQCHYLLQEHDMPNMTSSALEPGQTVRKTRPTTHCLRRNERTNAKQVGTGHT